MSAYMVQENHQENISTQLNQCKILVYFGTIYMELAMSIWAMSIWASSSCGFKGASLTHADLRAVLVIAKVKYCIWKVAVTNSDTMSHLQMQ